MATTAQIAEQVQFERDAIAQGLKRLHENTKKLERQAYASASVYGCTSIDTLLPLVKERIEETTEYKLKRGQGSDFKLIKEYVTTVEPLAAAAITLKVVFDRVFAAKDANQLVKVTEAIGQAVEQECQMRYYERVCPGLLKCIRITIGIVLLVHSKS